MKHVIRLGDPTTHGGTVVSASSTTIINGIRVARLGDQVTCIPTHPYTRGRLKLLNYSISWDVFLERGSGDLPDSRSRHRGHRRR